MGRLISIFTLVILLIGCGSDTIKIKTEVQETFVPILYSPAPPVIERPVLPIHRITTAQLQNDGMIVKYYKATVKTLIGYAKELETALYVYDKINKAYKVEEDKLRTKNSNLPKEQTEK